MDKITIGVWGTSIEWGHFDPVGGGWVNRLRSYFEHYVSNEATNKNFPRIYNMGLPGDVSVDLIRRFSAEAETRKPNIIIFAIGINDAKYIDSEDNPTTALPLFRKNLAKLITLGQKHTPTICCLGLPDIDESRTTPIPWQNREFYTIKHITRYDAAIEEICKKTNIHYVPLRGLLTAQDLFDGLHPNSTGHQKIFARIKNFLNESQNRRA